MTAELGHAAHSKRQQGMGILDEVTRPLTIVFLGAGSFFLNNLLPDILSIPGAEVGKLALVDIDTGRLRRKVKTNSNQRPNAHQQK